MATKKKNVVWAGGQTSKVGSVGQENIFKIFFPPKLAKSAQNVLCKRGKSTHNFER